VKKAEEAAYYESVNATRRDILVYQTPPLDKPLTFAGPLSAILHASSSARDTDWFMRLSIVESNGKIWNLVEARLRARFHTGTRTPELLEPGKVYAFPLDLWQTGVTVEAGQRLRIEIASASFPFFSRNLNTGGHSEKDTEFVPAEQVIYHDTARPTHVLLPVIPD
jgi:putative CocE/NonD family hydrolase